MYGENNFNPLGFAVVMTASMLSGLRWTITQVLLQGTPGSTGHGASGGPVEVLLQLTPGDTALILAVIILAYYRSQHGYQSRGLAHMVMQLTIPHLCQLATDTSPPCRASNVSYNYTYSQMPYVHIRRRVDSLLACSIS